MRALSHARHVIVNRLAMPIGAFVTLIAIGQHSDELLGQYALVMTFYFVMQMLPLLGLTTFVLREVGRDPRAAGRYLSTIGALSLAGCAATDAATFAIVGVIGYPAVVKEAIAIVGVLIFPGILLFIAEIVFMSVHRARPIAWVAAVENAVRVALSIAWLVVDGGLLGLFWVFLATRVAALAAYLVWLRRMKVVERWEPVDLALLRRTVRLLPSFFVGTVLLAVFSRVDFLVLSLFEAVESIGYYAVAYRPFEIGIMLLTALLMAFFPGFARAYSRTPQRFAARARNTILGFAAVLAAAGVAGVLVAHDYVYLLFSKQYPRPVALAQIYMAGLVLAGLDFVFGALLHASDRQQADARAMLLGGMAQIALLAVLVPPLGLYGAAAAKLCATLVQAATKFVFLRRAFGPIVSVSDAARALAVGGLLALGALAMLEASWPLRWLAALVLAFVVLPLSALAVGLLQPLRLLRAHRRPGHAADAATVLDLLDLVVADAREHARRDRHRGGRMDRRLAASLLYRVARYLHRSGRHRLAALVGRAGTVATRHAIDPASPTKPEWGTA